MDIHNAFLIGDLPKKVYLKILEEFARQRESKKVCKLKNLLSDLKQAPRPYMKLTEAIVQMGFQQSQFNYSLFAKIAGDDIVVI